MSSDLGDGKDIGVFTREPQTTTPPKGSREFVLLVALGVMTLISLFLFFALYRSQF